MVASRDQVAAVEGGVQGNHHELGLHRRWAQGARGARGPPFGIAHVSDMGSMGDRETMAAASQ